MTYILTWSNTSKSPIALEDGTINTRDTSLTLTGRGVSGWGQPLQENLIWLLENFASPQPPSTFTIGQSWYDTSSGRLNVNIGPYTSSWSQIAYRNIQQTPLYPIPGDTWFDMNTKTFNVYDSVGPNRIAFESDAQRGNYSNDTGIVNSIIISLNPPISSYIDNIAGSFKVGNTNSGPTTINAGGGSKILLNNLGVALLNKDLVANEIVSYVYVHTDDVFYLTTPVFSQISTTNQILVFSSNITWNLKLGAGATLTLTSNTNITAPSNLYVGSFILILIQDGTGSHTVTWDPIFKWPAGIVPVLSTSANATDVCSFYSDGIKVYGSYLRGVA